MNVALGEPMMSLTFQELAQLRRPLVYVWSRGVTVLYVGSSGNGVERPLATGHEKLREFQPRDTLTIWAVADAGASEVILIQRLKPVLNGRGPYGNQGPPCPVCGGRWRLADRTTGRCKWCQQVPGTDPAIQEQRRQDRDARIATLLREALQLVEERWIAAASC
ncbi:MAG TPA: hypothetical protein VNF03_13400 [Patescibacteria group bacterium]|nr:hypothetical protein [Patescibacteria group bacterium]